MYPPPPNSVLSRLEQDVVESVDYGKYTIHISFASRNRLSFGAPFRFAAEDAIAASPIEAFPLAESRLMRVVGCALVGIACDEDGTLNLRFSNGDTLVVYANDPMYEAYSLYIDGSEYFI